MENLTALEWLMEQWPILKSQLPNWLIKQALQMEKEQITDAVKAARQEDFWDSYNLYEDYYNKTFKKNLHDSKRKKRSANP